MTGVKAHRRPGSRSRGPVAGSTVTPLNQEMNQMAKKHIYATAAVTVLGLALAGCSSSGAPGGADNTIDGEPSGEITVLTQRTDIVNTTFKEYAEEFQKEYPDVTVKFEAIKDYEGQVKTRLNTKSYGDVLLIPGTVAPNQLANFFEDVTFADHSEFAQAGEFDRVIVERVQRYGATGDWPSLTSTLQ